MMKIVSYLAFTMLSITIQFGIIDYIQANNVEFIAQNKNLNTTSQKKRFSNILTDISNKPYALYYKINESALTESKIKNMVTTSVSSNSNVTDSIYETESPPTTSAYEILLFDDNTTANSITSEMPYTTTEIENATELIIFNKKNETAIKPAHKPKKNTYQKDCSCNLLYEVCDIHCCCDEDCTENELSMFNCTEKGTNLQQDDFYCSAPNEKKLMLNDIDNLFCVAQTNLPEKRIINMKEYDAVQIKKNTETALKWHDSPKIQRAPTLYPKNYTNGYPLMLLRNGSLSYIDLPFSKINNYCNDRTAITFLQEKKISCTVVIRDLEMFHIFKNLEDTSVISITNSSMNISALNCSNVHCTNWTFIVCDEVSCTNFNKTSHEPTCTDNIICTNVALKVEYIFYYYDSRIINATIYLYTQNVSPRVPFLLQEVNVKFYLLNRDLVDKVVKLSGQPGYIKGHPVIASSENGNYSTHYFNGSDDGYIFYPENRNGGCVLSRTTRKVVNFGSNKKSKCRYVHEIKTPTNGTMCEHIQKKVKHLLGFSKKIVVSPLGNPHDLKDEDWIELEIDASQLLLSHGEKVDSTLYCSHMITKLSIIFGYADVSDVANKGNIKILTAIADVTTQNLTFTDDNFSLVLSVETVFIDLTKPPVYEYAGSPQLNIHLPRDFFFPFPSNNKSQSIYKCNLVMLLMFIVVITFIPK